MFINIGLWSRDTIRKRPFTTEKIRALTQCLQALNQRTAYFHQTYNETSIGILVAPEYFGVRQDGGNWNGYNRFRSRAITEQTKNFIVDQMIALSRNFSYILIVPGTIAWKKPLDRSPHEQNKRDPYTGQRTGPPKPLPRRLKNAFRLIVEAFGPDRMAGHVLASPELRNAISLALSMLGFPATNDNISKVLQDATVRTQIINHFNLPPNCFHVMPTLASQAAQVSGGAPFMMRNTAYAFWRGRILLKYNKRGNFHEAVGEGNQAVFIPGQFSGTFSWQPEGRSFDMGLEVCLDHQLGYLMNDVRSNAQGPRDFYMVSSAWTTNNPANVPLKLNGCFLHACTEHQHTGLAQNTLTGLQVVPPAYTATVDNDPLAIWNLRV